MEKALFPLKYMKQTQGVNGDYFHEGSYAVDYGSRGTKENLYAPFTGVIKRIYTDSGNCVWLESKDKVLWADGTNDYMTVLTIHDDDVSDLKVGEVVKQGQIYYQQGSAGIATGVHTHIEVGRGKFTGNGWHQNENDIWMINNAVHPATAFFLTEDIVIVDDGGYDWKKLLGTPVSRDVTKNQIEVLIYNLRCRQSPNGKILGYINEGIYNILDKENNGNYEWYKVGANRWIAYSDSWAKLYFKKETNNNEEITKLKEKISTLETENNNLKQQINKLNNESQANFSYTCQKTDKYVIKLYKGETLYIKES